MGVLATQQLTEFLAVVSDRPDGPSAQRAAVEQAARALESEVAVILIDGRVMASVGFPAGRVPGPALVDVAAGRRSTIEVPGAGPCAVAVAPIGGHAPGFLILARSGVDEAANFTVEEMSLIRGMARVLELTLQALHMLAAERRQAEENGRLVETLQERQRLLEQLSAIQRAIARRDPLQQILDTITAGAQELLDVGMVGLNLLETDDPTLVSMRSSHGVDPEVLALMQRVPLSVAGVSGQAIIHDELMHVTHYAESPLAVPEMARASLKAAMAVPVHENGRVIGCLVVGSYRSEREWDKPDQDTLKAFAEHISLAVTDAKTLEAMHAAFHDSLTGLASRALFMTRMETAHAAGDDHTGIAALFVDLDRFKIVNDSLGHAAGDLLLVGVADRIRSCLRSGDMAARLGGDEFAVLMPNVGSAEEVVPVADRILRALREPFDLDGKEAFVSSSIGIAFSAAGETDAADLMMRADLAMYQAKKHGKDRFEVFEPEMQAVFAAGLELEQDLRRAVAHQEFVVQYQPVVHLRSGEITGCEALVRWQHPTRGRIAPLDFIPLAEETGMIVPIGEWVLREACAQAARWNTRRGTAKPLTISVNLSAVQLDQDDLPAVVADALATAGLPAESLVLELTESLLVNHSPDTARQLQDLKDLGVRLAIDDFGTGYSSLAYLRQFPVDIIKIDKSFVDDVGGIPAAAALTLGIIQLGHALQLSTIAEGIEDAAQLGELTDGNCELGQGYFFAEPLDAADLSTMLFP
jgi:diguanylate cyclase (GGDEF)-like protein